MELAELQDAEVGDGTTSVVIVAAELLKRANNLVRHKIHPTSIIGGYRLAMREARAPAPPFFAFLDLPFDVIDAYILWLRRQQRMVRNSLGL